METQIIALIRERLDATDRSHSDRFDAIDNRLDELTEQVRETNGKVRNHDVHIAGCRPIMAILQEQMRDYKTLYPSIMQEQSNPGAHSQIGEGRTITKWDVGLVLGTSGILFAILKAMGMLK